MKNDSKKVALVTGASKGIGAATARRLASEGVFVLMNYNNDDKAAREVLKEIESAGGNAELLKCSIADKNQREAMFEGIKSNHGKLDILVNNVGTIDGIDGVRQADTFRKTFEINLFSQIDITDLALDLMDEGKIIFISSVHGGIGRGNPGVAAYSASKAAMDSYLKNLAKQVAPKILVNGVAPGRTLTPMWGDMDDKETKERAKVHLTNRWIKPEEIADGVMFLVNNDSMCGEVIVIDGGMSLVTLG